MFACALRGKCMLDFGIEVVCSVCVTAISDVCLA